MPHFEDLDGVGEVVGEVIEEDVSETGSYNHSDKGVEGKSLDVGSDCFFIPFLWSHPLNMGEEQFSGNNDGSIEPKGKPEAIPVDRPMDAWEEKGLSRWIPMNKTEHIRLKGIRSRGI